MQGQELSQLLQSSESISQILTHLRNQIIQSQQLNELKLEDPIESLEKAVDLKMAFRFLVDGIQANRALVQVQKEQIQKKKVFLEGLQYYKATLKSQIGGSKLRLVDMKDYLQEQPSEQTNWIENFSSGQQKLITALAQFKERNALYEQKLKQKQQLMHQLQQSQEKYRKAYPQQLKKLYNQVVETGKVFNIKEIDPFSISQFKSKKIQSIHSLLYPLKLKEVIDIKHTIQSECEQLQITIQKGFFPLYEFARQNKIMVEEKQFKFYIASIQKQVNENQHDESLAVAISRRQDFTTEDIFNNLFLQERVKPIYQTPINQAQRNVNSKYCLLNWISQVLASTSSLINGSQLIDKIKNKVFSLNLIRYAVENITKKIPSYFVPLFTGFQSGSEQTQFPILESKRILVTKCQKTAFQQYRKQIFIPQWVQKALNKYKILKIESQINSRKKSNAVNQIDPKLRSALTTFIQNQDLEQLQTEGFYTYYKFEMVFDKNVLSGFILIPCDYPNKRSIFKLVSYKKANENHKNFKISENEVNCKLFTQQIYKLESELNEKIGQFLYKSSDKMSNSKLQSEENNKKQYFVLYFQINRLISLFIEKSLKN